MAEQDFPDEITYTLGKTFGTNFRRNNIQRVAIGRDCRLSSPRLYRKLLYKGLRDTGCYVLDLSIIPTPFLYFALFNLEVGGGVMITGSHNPPDNNGFKVCVGKGTIFGKEIQNLRKPLKRAILNPEKEH